MRKFILILLAAALVLGLAGCGQPAAGAVLESDKPREESPDVASDDLAALVDGNSEFAFDLYRALKDEPGNFFYSPYSISLALAMTYGGARGNTASEMADTLDFTLGQSDLHPAFNQLDLELEKRGEGASGKDGKGFRLNVVNAIWGQRDYEFLPEYLDLLAENYGAGMRTLDFMHEPEQSRVTINDWVSDQTEQRIKDLIPQGVIDDMTRLVLTNAIYFNAAWLHQFNEGSTFEEDFHLLDGSGISVPMMHETARFGYAAGDGYTAVELPYDGNEMSMVILLPDEGNFESFESSLSNDKVAGIIEGINYSEVRLAMPKWELESSIGLKDTLAALGMRDAFSPGVADFSGMDGAKDLFIQDVLHKAFVSVDENGTEAAAATAVIIGVTSAPAEPLEVRVDRPFIYLIRDIRTGTVLFAGRVINPDL